MSYKDTTVAEILAQPEREVILDDIRKVAVWTRTINALLVKINKVEKQIEERLNAGV